MARQRMVPSPMTRWTGKRQGCHVAGWAKDGRLRKLSAAATFASNDRRRWRRAGQQQQHGLSLHQPSSPTASQPPPPSSSALSAAAVWAVACAVGQQLGWARPCILPSHLPGALLLSGEACQPILHFCDAMLGFYCPFSGGGGIKILLGFSVVIFISLLPLVAATGHC